jgi:adenosine deaminase
MNIESFIAGMPKAELHLHIEGTFEPELMFEIAARNNKKLKFPTVEALRTAYHFSNLQEFLDIYYEGAGVLINEQDFYDLTMAYLKKVHQQNVVHTEIFFDPQTHTARDVAFGTVITGIHQALQDAHKNMGLSSRLIMSYLRHLDEASAFETLKQAEPYLGMIAAVGLDSSERGNPPEKFTRVFERSRSLGLLTVAHAGEEGPAEYISGALEHLKVSRIDHGNRSLDDPELLKLLASKQIPLTVCPLSNLKLCVVKDITQHPLRKLMEAELLVTVNSDDPAYFGGYMNENYLAVQKALNLSAQEIVQLAANSFRASFITDEEKQAHLSALAAHAETYKPDF